MFGLFWLARRATRRSSGGGCLGFLLIAAVVGGITGTQSIQTPTAGQYGYTQGPGGTLIPSNGPDGGGGHYVGGPAWTPGPLLPAHVATAPAPAVAAAPATHWGLITLVAIIVIIGGLAIIGSRMAPAPITARPKKSALINDFYPCCGMPTSWEHANICPAFRQPPENPAKDSDRR